MQNLFRRNTICITGFLSLALLFSCKKEYLDPDTPPGYPEPLVYVTAKLNGDSVSFSGGENSYNGSVSVSDSLSFRTFNFILNKPQHPLESCFEISINNYRNVQGILQQDLDSSIYIGTRHYQDTNHFMPLAAKVVWFDSTGIKFSSELLQQTHLFSINTVEDVIFENAHYKQTTIEFNCNLSDNHGHILHLINGKATILFGIN